ARASSFRGPAKAGHHALHRSLQAACDDGAREFLDGTLPDPSRRRIRRPGKTSSDADGVRVEGTIAPADQTQRPAHAFLDEVPIVAGGTLDERKSADERLVAGALVVQRKAREQRKRRALDELSAPVVPRLDLGPRV